MLSEQQLETAKQQRPVANPVNGFAAPDESQAVRAGAYALLASLLRNAPDHALLNQVAELIQQPDAQSDELLIAMSTLGLSARTLTAERIEDEFHSLFIGLGKGEVTPYASWYLTGFLMEKPLSDLRDDLRELGYQRQESVNEPEDHAAALFEVMAMMIEEQVDFEPQKQFFDSHLNAWVGRFFNDLMQARSAVFYKSLGRFGAAFIRLEQDYLAMPS